jgi:uncharacterized protein YvpB
MIHIVDNNTEGLVTSVKSNPFGETKVDGLIIGKEYIIKVAPKGESTESISTKNGERTGPNPHKAYAGNPRDLRGGWYVFANPIVKAAKDVITAGKLDLKAENISGSTRDEILSYIDQKIPVVVWVTLDLSPPIKRGGWYIEGTNEFHSSFTNLHAVVLNGWEGSYYKPT